MSATQHRTVASAAATRVILHVDMDAFYASVEELDFPEYRGRPLIVGADPKQGRGRGVVSTCNYAARKFGVRSAMPISRAWRLCPHGVFVAHRFERYAELSRRIMGVLRQYSPLVEQVSIDEAFLDCTGEERLFGTPEQLARRIKIAIRESTGLTASVGVAPNKYIAKVASDVNKPDGLAICETGREKEFLAPLPVERLWGAGGKTAARLHSLGYARIGDIQQAERATLLAQLGAAGDFFWELANGIDERPVQTGWRRKSISEETTFETDLGDADALEKTLFSIADSLARRMRSEEVRGRTVQLKLRLQDFETFTRNRTLESATDDTFTIYQAALELFRHADRKQKRVRLIGIGMANLLHPGDAEVAQLDLFAHRPAETEKRKQREVLLDRLKKRFGDTVTRGSLLEP